MKVTSLETTIVSVPYRHRETSSRVRRDGVTDVLVKIGTDTGLVGWGETPDDWVSKSSVPVAERVMTPLLASMAKRVSLRL